MNADPHTPVIFTQTYVKPDGHYTQIDSWIGGTSLAAPMTAALMALADERAHRPTGSPTRGCTGWPGSSAFHDITPTDGTAGGAAKRPHRERQASITRLRSIDHDSSLRTAPGWDNVTGLGSPTPGGLCWALRP